MPTIIRRSQPVLVDTRREIYNSIIWPLIVPSHRVVKTDGGLGGYSFGLIQKEALLDLERSTAPYVGCASTRIFCRKGCTHERRIRDGGRIHFASGADATMSGYRACQVCRPA